MENYKAKLVQLKKMIVNYGGDPLKPEEVTLIKDVTERSEEIYALTRDIVFSDGDDVLHINLGPVVD